MADAVVVERRGPVQWVTFDRPEARNAFTFAMYDRLGEIVAALSEAPEVRALVLTGAGGKAFAAGTDIAEFRAFGSADDALAYEARIEAVLSALERTPVPTIAAIAGACTGGGAGIAAACDIRLCTRDARIGFPIARTLGNCLSMANYARLVALLGPARVKEMVFTARLLDAEAALGAGFVSEVVVDHAALLARASELAVTVSSHAPLTLAATKEALRRLQAGEREGEDLVVRCYTSEDFREGLDAFLAKRPPQWTGR